MIRHLVIICHFGASSCLLEDRMQRAAVTQGVNVIISAVSELKPSEITNLADVILVAPQLRYKRQEVVDIFGGKSKPILFIDPQDYGNLDGGKILKQALEAV